MLRYGRTGVYELQELLSLVTSECSSRREELKVAKGVMGELPSNNR